MSKSYIHYGSDKFDINQFQRFEVALYCDLAVNKPAPKVELWGSPVDCYICWKDWCEGEDFHTEKLEHSFTFTLSADAKILTVRKCSDIMPFYKRWSEIDSSFDDHDLMKAIDYQAIFDAGYDGIELIHSPKYYNELHMGPFYSWDVDSILVWNPDVIIS